MSPVFTADSAAHIRARRIEGPSLLVATLEIQEAQFRRTVVLVAEHTSAGAIGFVINRPSPVSLSQVLSESLAEQISTQNSGQIPVQIPGQIPVWYGGPVESRQGLILHNQKFNEGDTRIADGISLSSVETSLATLISEETRRLKSLEDLKVVSPSAVAAGLLPGFESLYPYRYLTGYSGWGAGQLEEEILSGAWLELPLDRKLIFNTAWHNMWDRAMGGLGVTATNIAPQQPSHSWLN